MQLVYGNDGQNYTTITKSAGITDVQEARLLEDYRGYGYVKNREAYSDPSKEPVSLTYVTTDLLESNRKNVLLVKNARMTNYTTLCSYTHMRLFESDKELYGKYFLNLLRAGFLADVELNAYKNQNIDTIELPQEKYVPDEHALSEKQLYSLVTALLDAADSYIEQIKVIVDEEGDNYNHRALDIIASVYRYIPYNIRMTAGFSTYADPASRIPDRVKMQLYTREAVGKLKGIVIDLSQRQKNEDLGYASEELKKFSRMLIDLSDESREKLFMEFQGAFELEDATVRDHIVLYRNKTYWLEPVCEESWRQWISFADTERRNGGESQVLRVFQAVISKRVLTENLQESYRVYLKDILKRQGMERFDEEMHTALDFTEEIAGLDFCLEDFVNWENEAVIAGVCQRHQDEREQKIFFTKIKAEWLKTMPDSKKFEKVKSELLDSLDDVIQVLQVRIRQKTEEEKVKIKRFIQSKEWNLDNWKILERQYQAIIYEENYTFFSTELADCLDDTLANRTAFQDMGQYEEYRRFLECCEALLKPDRYKNLMELLERKGAFIEELEKARRVIWSCWEDVSKTYWNLLTVQKYILMGYRQITYILDVFEEEFQLEPYEMEGLLKYIETASEESEQVMVALLQREKRLLDALLELKAFEVKHFESLFYMADQIDQKLKKPLLSYYLYSDVLLTKKEAKAVLLKVNSGILRMFQNEWSDTILDQFVNKEKDRRWMKYLMLFMAVLFGAILGAAGAYLFRLR